jgi:superfamily II DNA helicase RecQ
MVGDIQITNEGDFIRYFKSSSGKVYKKEGMYSPIVQNERHVALIKDIIRKEGYPTRDDYAIVKHIVTIANPKAIVNSKYAKKELKEHIIKHDQLINKMKKLHEQGAGGTWFTEKTMYEIADMLIKHSKPQVIDYKKKYKLYDIKDNEIIEKVDTQNIEVKNKEIVQEEDKPVEQTVVEVEESTLYNELKKYRLDKSREEKVKPYFLYNNAELDEIVEVKPKTLEELRKVRGFGEVKCGKYGADIVEIVKRNL